MRPLCCDQLETLTQGYYPRIDLLVINAAPRRRKQLPLENIQYKTDVVVGVSGAQRWAGGMVSFFPNLFLLSRAVAGRSRDECLSFNHLALSVQSGGFFLHPGTHFLRPRF